MNRAKKIIGLAVLALFCMAPGQCNPKDNQAAEGAKRKYHCVIIPSVDTHDNGSVYTHRFYEMAVEEVAPHDYRWIKGSSNIIRCSSPGAKSLGGGKCITDHTRWKPGKTNVIGFPPEYLVREGIESPYKNPVKFRHLNMSVSRSWEDIPSHLLPPDTYGFEETTAGRYLTWGNYGTFEVCRELVITPNVKKGVIMSFSYEEIKHNTEFGDGSSRCTLPKISGPPTCGGY